MTYDKQLVDSIKEILSSSQSTIAVAESVTAGHIQAALSLATKAAEYFQGGITCYNLGQKTKHLNVEPTLAEKSNCIHQKIAAQMAKEICKLFISNYGIGITGYATVVPEIEEEGIFAFVAIVENGEVVVERRLTSKKEDPLEVQVDYTMQALQVLHQHLQKK
ncbi:CinA family protein [Aridibaculum aurantiacum]|uniref:CinA family protein n=1 Tax=Aridibaculum aurantiacum TaxID=2810307 RepID=UPI001A974A81|nr:nicotinamide-nucleotide amidohydrolase family protein [Aridibaculum aurantiacum]